ncbi:MAG: hypothetical protein QOC81_2543 [Thermoanaerobaculia bacterium]|jgi:hypothetical protein|nr:hypothetical protein [Thermoanaerobaculia bacterium]
MAATLPRELIPITKLLEKDEPRVLVAVGAGVSIGATGASHASWLGLLKHGVKHLVETEVFTSKQGDRLSETLDSAFSPFDLHAALNHAELVEQNLKTPDTLAFARWLEAAFSDFRVLPERSETLGAIRDLQQSGALMLTTNYDSLLSEVTGLPPVTWEEHDEFLQVVRRQRRGVLHVHGHWQRPSSIVLGKSSYDRNAADEDFQDLFRILWLEQSWLYVGFGDGLADPNLGRLLEWGKRWNKNAPSDYFLAKSEQAIALTDRPDKPASLICIGYQDHDSDLPSLLQSLTPSARCWPFVPVDADFALFRSPGSPLNIPFPSHQEYLDGAVPVLTVDPEVRDRLEKHGWAFVLDVASVGKTTLAMRIATAPGQRDYPSFYLDLATVDADDADGEVSSSLQRLSRSNALLILDNVHHQPEFARQLWDQWRQRPGGSRLLLVATRIQRLVTTAPAQDVSFFEHYATNPAVGLRPMPSDLGAIAKHLYERVGGRRATPLEVTPSVALERWHSDYGSALGAFCLAALGRLADFQRGQWELPLESASDWVREKWLKPLDEENRENVLCLAVFGGQELELQVQNEALPYPGRTEQLLRMGLVAETQRGLFGQYHSFSLREPGWGALLLAAQVPDVDEERLLLEAAARHPMAALLLSARLRRERSFELLDRLWAYLALKPDRLLDLSPDFPLGHVPNLAKEARIGKQPQLANRLWETIELEPENFAERAWETSLQSVASFLDAAKGNGRDTTPLWAAIERDPDKLAERAWETSLQSVVEFFDTAKHHRRDSVSFWAAFERDPAKLVERAWETPLFQITLFLNAAKRHHRDTGQLWDALERLPAKLVERMWETPLDHVAFFLDTAKTQGRDATPLWEALERDPDKLAERMWETSLGYVASFLDTAKRHKRDTTPLWEVIERHPDKLAERASGASLHVVGFFLDTAKRHGRDTLPMWSTIERDTLKLAKSVWETELGDLVSFLDAAKRHGRDTAPLWEAIEREPDKLVERAWETPLENVGSFLATAKKDQRSTATLWEAIEREPARLAKRAWETPLDHLASFLKTANQDQRKTATLWEAIEREPAKLAERMWETPLGHVASFLETANQQGRDTSVLWAALESLPDKLSERVLETPLNGLATFLDIAKKQERDTEALLRAFESRPTRLSELAKESDLGNLAGFCHYAPDSLVRIALADFHTTHWDKISITVPLLGATKLAARFGNVGREDLKSALIHTLLRRASRLDFPLQSSGLANVAWLLSQTTAVDRTLVAVFLDILCTNSWLGNQFTFERCGLLANGLGILALHQPEQIRNRFRNPSLNIRIRKELSRFGELTGTERSQVIQLLGWAALFGATAKSIWFNNVALSTVGSLPEETLPHRVEADKVETWQFQLWLGLRAVTEVTGKPLEMPSAVIDKTLDLWRCNLAETSVKPESAEHFVNQFMVRWLERCSRENRGLLPPST